MNPEKQILFQPNSSQDLTVTPKIEELPKMTFEKADTPVALPCVIPKERNRENFTLEVHGKLHTNKIPDPESTM